MRTVIHTHTHTLLAPQVEGYQGELDRVAATLKQVEAYNEAMKGEIAVTRRAAYAAEGRLAGVMPWLVDAWCGQLGSPGLMKRA